MYIWGTIGSLQPVPSTVVGEIEPKSIPVGITPVVVSITSVDGITSSIKQESTVVGQTFQNSACKTLHSDIYKSEKLQQLNQIYLNSRKL